jgi:two-component system OmpR family sensor kinase/two-component system sensor histidine kinase BaeS
MKKNIDATTPIRRRLFMLLMRAFSLVVVLLLISLFSIAVYSLSFSNSASPLDRFPIVTRLETYYMTIASWEGVGDIFRNDLPSEELRVWRNTILIGADGKIVAYQGDTKDDRAGQLYTIQSGDTLIPLTVQGKEVGLLILTSSTLRMRGAIAFSLLGPVAFISIFLAILTVIIGLLLMRRVVNPLAEVIAAARRVASGDLSTRVPVSGPDDLRALSDSFNHMAETLDLNDRERRDLLADIAHELRTPLTVIRGKLEGIVDGVYPPDETQIGPALSEAYLLERLVDDLRLLTLAETRQLHFEPRDVSFEQLASHAVDLFSAEAAEKKISLHLENRAQGIQIHVDPQRTEQVIGNLISNALRYVPESGKIWIIVEQSDNSVCLQVNDNGPGVPPEDLPHLFQRFWRGEKSRSRASGGAGLGLAIASQLIEAQGGSIKAKNLPEGGLQVSISFPMVDSNH